MTLGGDLEDIEARLLAAQAGLRAGSGSQPILVEISEALRIIAKWTTNGNQ